MIIVRPITLDDEEAYVKFAFTTHIGVTSLPNNKRALHERMEHSLESFKKQITKAGKELYLFVLEDTKTKERGGTCGIYAKTGITNPIFFYKIETIYQDNHSLPVPTEIQVLHTVTHQEGPTEICGIYLLPSFRHEGVGRLLSLSRFMFIATFPERFDQVVLSNMRGVIDENDRCPFWDGVGSKFLNLEFSQVMSMLNETREFIPHFLPKYPIYVSLLPEETQECIGIAHPHSKPALNMLEQEGLLPTSEIDIFDGGPVIAGATHEIRTVRDSREVKVGKISDEMIDSEIYIIGNNRIDFRACFGKIKINENGEAILYSEIAEALNVSVGDKIRYVSSGHHHKDHQ